MASFKGKGRGEGSKKRPSDPRRRRQGLPSLEVLENRRLLSGGGTPTLSGGTSSGNLYNVSTGPMADEGQDLIHIYQQYQTWEQNGAKGTFTNTLDKYVNFYNNTNVGIDASYTGSMATYEATLKSLGMFVIGTNSTDQIVEGWLPIASLYQVAIAAQTVDVSPVYTPTAYYEGVADNQAVETDNTANATTQLGVTGAGSTIGVISTSFNHGTPDAQQSSYLTGDLPTTVNVLDDSADTDDDEGRGMLENIYDIAPGAKLAFATGLNGQVAFANNIAALASTAGANIIVDDLGIANDPYFQDGVISQAINTFVGSGGTYLAAAGNEADSGYLSNFRAVSATVGSLGAGTYMNFDGSGATVSPELPINLYDPGTGVVMQFDQPFDKANGAGVSSEVDLYLLDQNGNIVGQSNNNNVTTNEPIQAIFADNNGNAIQPGLYNIVAKLVSGPAPGHIVFYSTGDGGFSVSRQFGTAGSTSFPSTFGHNSGANTISVGAVPFWGAEPYTDPTTVYNEPFSSTGPRLIDISPDGTPITPTVLLKPDLSAADGGVTSFFPIATPPSSQNVDTTNPFFPTSAFPPYPGSPQTVQGEPVTATDLNYSKTLPDFFGTSSASPNLAAIVALMKQASPNATRAQILTALDSTATPLDGGGQSVWTPQGGYGLADALAAVQAIQQLKVTFISPGANQTVTTAPSSITVSFSQAVKFSTITASDLTVNGPNGSKVTVGTPISVGGSATPTQVTFPITITPAAGTTANGLFTDHFSVGTITSASGSVLSAPVSDQFVVNVTNGPRVTATSFVGRIVNIVFSEPINAATVTQSNIYLFRDNGGANFNPNGIIVSDLPGAVMTYNASTLTVTIDLTGVAQSALPTDHYGLVVSNAVTDTIGVPLNGLFNGVFPSGTPTEATGGSLFFQDLGTITLQAPIITFLGLTAASDSGIQGDFNTNDTTPSIFGQIAAKFPATVSGDLIYAEFNGISHAGVVAGGLDLAVGSGGRGFVGHYDVVTTTNALGQFIINYPAGVTPLPNGENQVKVVVIGQPDSPPFPGLSASQSVAFRVDTSLPYVGIPGGGQATSIPQGANINSLTSLTINVLDPVNPQSLASPFAVSPNISVPALNPTLADNISNYALLLVNGTATPTPESQYITSATFTSTSARVLSSDPYTGTVTLTFAPGLPTGSYKFVMISSAYGQGGLADAAGNAFAGYSNEPLPGGSENFELDFNLQPTPTYITSYQALTPDSGSSTGFDQTDVRSNYEITAPGVTPRAEAPPTEFKLDFSNTLNLTANYTNKIELVRSANSPVAQSDGDFGDLGITNTSGFTPITGVTITLQNSVAKATAGQYGYMNELLIKLPAGFTLPADYYRLYIPNSATNPIDDIFGNQLDGEFLGYQNAQGKYVDQLPNGTVRGSGATDLPDLTGDGTPGGSFMTGFVVVPNGDIIYARADAPYNPSVTTETPNGSAQFPYPVLAPEAIPTNANGGDLNSSVNAGSNFNTLYDYSGDGVFEPSAFYAAQLLDQETGGPVVIIAEASIPSRDPNTGDIIQKPFVLQAPAGSDGSASIPAMTTLVFQAGTILKMQNATLFVQNQGSALQIDGGPNSYQTVTITSYKDSSVGGVSNGNPNSTPNPGDYGGIVFRNYTQAAIPGTTTARTTLFPGQIPITNTSTDGLLKGPFANSTSASSQVDAVSGADDIMSYISFLTEKFGGGVVPQTNGTQYDGVTLLNSRPTIVNTIIAEAGGVGAAVAGLSVDVDSLRADGVAQGPLLRADSFVNNGLNGIYIRAQASSGIAEPTNAVVYPDNPASAGGTANYVLDDPYPYLLTSVLNVGTMLIQESGGAQQDDSDRVYITPGMLVKFELGAGILVNHQGSLNVGDSTYIKQFDANNNYGPTLPDGTRNPNFVANSTQLAQVVLTSLDDDTASTSYYDPISKKTTTIVAALPALDGGSGANQPAPGAVPAAARWGGITLYAGSVDVINDADIRYGGGVTNTPTGSENQHVLEVNPGDGIGANIMITDNTFSDNLSAPIGMTPNALEAGNPQEPLATGDPFINGNTFTGNGLDGVLIEGGTDGVNAPNLNVNSVWTGGDFTYILTRTIVLDGEEPGQIMQTAQRLLFNGASTTLLAEPLPDITLTLQSTLPGTILANGQVVAAPGVPLVVKLDNAADSTPTGTTEGKNPAAAVTNSYQQGAGFLVGVDNGIDPTADSLVDPGAFSALRIVGIGADQATGQARVPVIITSLFDNSVGTTVNGVTNDIADPGSTATPKAGDGGIIEFGANSQTVYDLQDPRYGSLIDNADISYLTEIEQQGGGLIYGFDTTNSKAFTPTEGQLYGLPLPGQLGIADQFNQAKSLTISDSNLSNFSVAAFVATPGYGSLVIPVNYPSTTGIARDTSYPGEPTHDYFVNDTISNMSNTMGQDAVQILSDAQDDTSFPAPAEAVFLNDTFYSDAGGIHTFSPAFDLKNALSETSILVMDSIFDTITNNAIQLDGQSYGSEVQYNLFYQVTGTTPTGPTAPYVVQTLNNTLTTNDQPVFGNPEFRSPSTGNFNLLANSAAIDLGRSELGPSIFGDMLYPSVTVDPSNLSAVPIRNEPGFSTVAGGVNVSGGNYPVFDQQVYTPGLFTAPYPNDIVTLPGESVAQRGFPDEWIAVSQSSGLGTQSPDASLSTYAYQPITGQRDQNGNLRVKDPNSTNVGFGSNPFFDLGAFEYIIQNPPVVESVSATSAGSTTSMNIYGVGTIAGTNQLPTSIQIVFNQQINPATLTSSSVTLEASGGTGMFNNNPSDKFYNLAGLLSFNNATDTLTINTSTIFTSAAADNDEYQIVLMGSGAAIIKNTDGVALDGLNLDANGNQLALPSGADLFPGSNFYVTFTIDTHAPTLVAGTFKLAPASDSSGGKSITNITTPTFDGTITDVFPPTNPLVGDTVSIDVSTLGDGNFNLLNAGTGVTNALGQFVVTLTTPIPNTPNTVGTNGIQGAFGGVYTLVRVRVTDLAGNTSTLLTAPYSTFVANNSVTYLQEDTIHPQITAFSPPGNTVATTNASGEVTVSVTFDKNVKNSTLSANSVLVERTGGTGSFANPIAVPIVSNSFVETYSTAPATLGYETVTFEIAAPLPNDEYEVILKGTGTTPITDIAGNALSGAFAGTFPTGNTTTGSDFTSLPFSVYQPAAAHLIYVQAPTSPAPVTSGVVGSRTNPFPTIAEGMAAASIGDVVLVLPGTYREDVTVKPGVRLLSAGLTSTPTTFTPGVPDQTLIYGVPANGKTLASSNNDIVTVAITGSVAGIPTEVSGFSIISPLIGNTVTGTIDPTNVAILAVNSNASIDRNNVVNGGIGVDLATSGTNAATSDVFDNVVAGNIYGVLVSDDSATTSIASPFMIVNNTIVDNTYGLANFVLTPNSLEAYVLNNIFSSNHDLTSSRNGTGIASNQADTLGVGYNLFYQNGATNSPASQASGVFGQFNPAALSNVPDALNNILGNPSFVAAEDPRPNGDTPAVFFNYGNFDLTTQSVAINAANQTQAPTTDFLYRAPIKISGHGFTGTGPASIGAYYPDGTSDIPLGTGTAFTGSSTTTGTTGGTTGSGSGGSQGNSPGGTVSALALTGSGTNAGSGTVTSTVTSSVGGGLALGTKQFTVVTTSLSSDGTAHAADGLSGGTAVESGPNYIDINFSDNVNSSTLNPNDVALSGTGLSSTNPAKVTSLAWIDDHAVRFFITGGYANSGTVNISIPAGAITDANGDSIVAFSDSIRLPSGVLPSPAAPVATTVSATPSVTPATLAAGVLPVTQPIAAASPVAVASTPALTTKASTSKSKAHHVTPVKKTDDKHAAAKAVHKAAPAKPAKVVHKAAVKVVHKATAKKK